MIEQNGLICSGLRDQSGLSEIEMGFALTGAKHFPLMDLRQFARGGVHLGFVFGARGRQGGGHGVSFRSL
jgi:hypothetical protein